MSISWTHSFMILDKPSLNEALTLPWMRCESVWGAAGWRTQGGTANCYWARNKKWHQTWFEGD